MLLNEINVVDTFQSIRYMQFEKIKSNIQELKLKCHFITTVAVQNGEKKVHV